MRTWFRGLWQNSEFLKLWSGQTISVFGSMIGGTAMSFTAILFLQATPFEVGLLRAMELVPAFLIGLFAGAWVDRLRRRPLLILADIGRALALAAIPLAALAGSLDMVQIYIVALVVSVLTILFNLAYQSYLPALIGKEGLLEGNSKLSASAAAAEFAGFNIGGWLVQIFTAPMAILIDAFSFLISAFSIGLIRTRETPLPVEEQPDVLSEIRTGLRTVWRDPLLRSSGAAILFQNLTGSMVGAVVVIYMSRELGFAPGILGMIWAVGGISSFAGAALAPRITRRVGSGRVMVFGLALFGVSQLFIPLASGATILSAVLLILQQLGDGFYVAYEINQVSLRQRITAEQLLGRVNATMYFLALGADLIGTLAGGALGGWIGIRTTLFLAASGTILVALFLVVTPLRHAGDQPQPAVEA